MTLMASLRIVGGSDQSVDIHITISGMAAPITSDQYSYPSNVAHPRLGATVHDNAESHREAERERTQHGDRGDHTLVHIRALIVVVLRIRIRRIVRGIVVIIGVGRLEVADPVEDLVAEVCVGEAGARGREDGARRGHVRAHVRSDL